MTFDELADALEAMPVDDGIIEIDLTPVGRDMIVAALRGASALRALAELPPQTTLNSKSAD